MEIIEYRFGLLVVDNTSYQKDVIIIPPRIISPWWRKEGHRLQLADLDELLRYTPEIVIIGTGAYGRMEVHADTRQGIEDKKIMVEVMPTQQAYQRFNELIQNDRKVAAAFHLTC